MLKYTENTGKISTGFLCYNICNQTVMDMICNTIKSFLSEYGLDKPDLTYIVAFSGGYDSMSLMHALKNICSNRIIAIHLNHKWRGAESDNEEQKCAEFCEKIGVDFYSEAMPDNVAHTETAARDARYKFFKRCAKKFDSRVIFTAHNKNDNAETLIYRICMGTGVNGLQGICSVRDIFYRPLLSVERSEIEKYCKDNNLTPNIDSSNSDTKYKRNYIRSEVFPVLRQINPNIIEMLTSLSEVAKEEFEITSEYISRILKDISDGSKIRTKDFLNLSDAVQNRIIYDIFIKNNLDYDRKKVLKIKDFINGNSNSKSGKKSSLTRDLWIFASENHIEIIEKKTKNNSFIKIEKEGKYEFQDWIFEIEKFDKAIDRFPKDTEKIAYVDLKDNINFELRNRSDGDVIKPFGLGGTQKLKKYFNEKKIPNHEKDFIILLAKGNEILWAAGVGISDTIKVEKNPTHRLRLYKTEGI